MQFPRRPCRVAAHSCGTGFGIDGMIAGRSFEPAGAASSVAAACGAVSSAGRPFAMRITGLMRDGERLAVPDIHFVKGSVTVIDLPLFP